ncbi:phospholipase-like protein [Tanacetum coccineum]
MSDFYDVKISVRSSVKLLIEITGLLSGKPNRERLFRDTVFGPWLDIQSHDNDNHMMHYVLQHQIWILESCPNIKKWWSKKANVIPRGLAWSNVKKFEKSDYYLFGPLSNPNVALISCPEEMRQAWFIASVDYIKGLADQDGNVFQDDEARVNCIEHNNGMCGDTKVGKFVQDEEARVNGIEHHNGVCGDTEVGKFVQDEEARVNGIEHHNGMCGDTEVGKFVQDKEARVNGIEHHNGMCVDTEDGNFAEGIDETICPKSNQMSVEKGDGVLDSEGDGVHLSQTNDVIKQAVNLSTMSSTSPQAINPVSEDMPNFCSNHNDTSNHIGGLSTEAKHPSSSSSHPGNDKDASHLDDLMEIDGENVKDGYTNSQDHLHLLIKALESKTENPTLDVVLEQEPDKFAVKQGILEQQSNAPKGKTTVFEDTVGVKVNEKPGLEEVGYGSQTTIWSTISYNSSSKKKKSRIMKIEVIVPPFDLEDFSGQPQIRSINHIMTHEPFVENMSRTDDCKSDKVTVPEHMCEFITNKALLEYQYPWGKRDIVISRSFWLSLSCLNTGNSGWLNDHHLDLWIDLMWSLDHPRQIGLLSISVNEPKTHWCLADLEIHTGVVTFYDSLGWAGGSRRRWWRRMKKLLLEKLTVYLVMHGILESKGISADDYKITYKYADAPFQASLFGDYGI